MKSILLEDVVVHIPYTPSKSGQPIPGFHDLTTRCPVDKLPPWREGKHRDLTVLLDWARPTIAEAVRSWKDRGGSIDRLAIEVEVIRASQETPSKSELVLAHEAYEPHAADVVPVGVIYRTDVYQFEHSFELPIARCQERGSP